MLFKYLTKILSFLCLESFKYLSMFTDEYLNDPEHKGDKFSLDS